MAVNNSLARQDQSMKLSVYLQNDAVKKQINQVVGGKNGTRFISSIVSAVQSTPALQECTSPNDIVPELDGHDAIRVEVLQSGYLFSTEVDLGRYQMICRLIYK